MTHRLKDFEPWMGEIEMRTNGSLIASETGTAYAYSIDKLQDRGRFFIAPMDEVYCGQVVGESTRQGDITINVTKAKQLTNMRASGADDKAVIVPPKVFSLEEALEYIKSDEYVEVTPKSMRLRKILLSEIDRKRAAKQEQYCFIESLSHITTAVIMTAVFVFLNRIIIFVITNTIAYD